MLNIIHNRQKIVKLFCLAPPRPPRKFCGADGSKRRRKTFFCGGAYDTVLKIPFSEVSNEKNTYGNALRTLYAAAPFRLQ